jgi:16S rRNA G1207 methylase RsmC
MRYEYPYLIKNDVRAKYLFEHLRPHLLPGDCIVDAGCGYSPISYNLLEN